MHYRLVNRSDYADSAPNGLSKLLVEVGSRLVDTEDYSERVPLGVQLGQLFAGQVAQSLGRLDLRLDLIGETGVLTADRTVPVAVARDSHSPAPHSEKLSR